MRKPHNRNKLHITDKGAKLLFILVSSLYSTFAQQAAETVLRIEAAYSRKVGYSGN